MSHDPWMINGSAHVLMEIDFAARIFRRELCPRMKWLCRRITQTVSAKRFWSENLKGRDHLEDLGVEGTIISECILVK
jgi:hypothetical protein